VERLKYFDVILLMEKKIINVNYLLSCVLGE
jgi:hypothetical protein